MRRRNGRSTRCQLATATAVVAAVASTKYATRPSTTDPVPLTSPCAGKAQENTGANKFWKTYLHWMLIADVRKMRWILS